MSDDSVFKQPSQYQWAALLRTMASEGVLPDVPLEALDEYSTLLLSNRMTMELESVPYGGLSAMMDVFEDELKTARGFDSVDELMAYLGTPIPETER